MEKKKNLHNNSILQIKQVTKVFPGVVALDHVNFNVRRGTVHALVGENGAGKSTLMKVLCGVEHADEGEIFFAGETVHYRNASESIGAGISMIYQELNLAMELTVAENIFMGRYPMKSGVVSWKAMYEEADRLIQQYGLDLDVHMPVGNLSVSQMQMLEIIKAISYNSQLIVMDEPSSSITEKEVERLFGFIRALVREGKTIIYISHKLDEVFQIADEITVMRDGQVIASRSVDQFDKTTVIQMMVNRELKDLFPKRQIELGEIVMSVEDIASEGVFEKISFEVRKGEIFGIVGLMGSKRTELVRAIVGLDPRTNGQIRILGKPVRIRNVRDSINAGISMVSEDRKRYGLVLVRSIRENIALPNLSQLTKGPLTNKNKEVTEAMKYAGIMRLKMTSLDTLTNNLSGGNQQKVVLSKWLMSDPKVLILDEPTRGIDVGSKAEIYKLIGEMAASGIAIILISSEMPEVLGLSDRVLIMHDGKQKGLLSRKDLDQETIMSIILNES